MLKTNLIKTVVASVITLIFLSCSSQEEINPEANHSLGDVMQSSDINNGSTQQSSAKPLTNTNGQYIIYATNLISEELNNPNKSTPVGLNQKTLDYFSNKINLSKNAISLSLAEEVIAKVGAAERDGIQSVLNDMSYSTYTKTTLASIASGQTIPASIIKKQLLGVLIPAAEKELILSLNSLMLEYDSPVQKNSGGTAVGAAVGFIVGTAVCGPLCGVGGAILGAIAGSGTDKQ